MKKACICILVPLFLFNISLKEVLKVPVLYAHFMEHRSLDHSISMLDFLAMHYIGDDQNTRDQERDMELPFKKIDTDNSFQLVPIPLVKPVVSKASCLLPKKRLLPNFRDFHLTDPSSVSLFRPPIS